MAQGRGNACKRWAVPIAILSLILHWGYGEAQTHTVGDSRGWTFHVNNWPDGKHFTAGDVLRFNYDPTVHNVVAVDRSGYESCTTPAGAQVHRSGMDEIGLRMGENYFICSVPNHCQSGMKIAINAV